MNTLSLKSQLAVFFQTLPPSNINPDKNYINNFTNLFFRFLTEIPGEGLAYPQLNRITAASINTPIKDVFEQNLTGIATTLITSEEYSTKVGSALDSIIQILPQIFILNPNEVPFIAPFSLSTDIVQLLDPVFLNPTSTSFDLASAIVDGFTIKLNASSINNANARTSLNWITN